MSDPAKFDFKNSGNSVPQAYEELLVPRMFVPLGKLLLDEAGVAPGESVLDVACGPGTVSRLAAERVGPKGKVTATDFSPPMLAIARAKPSPPNSAAIHYVESPAVPLNVDDTRFDVTLCQQGLQFFPEKVESLREMARVTRPGGRLAVTVWGSLQECEFWGEIHAALQETVASEIADLMKVPFSLCQTDRLKALGDEAGLKDIQIETHSLTLTFEDGLDQAVRALDATPLAPKLAELPSQTQKTLAERLKARFARFANGHEYRSELKSNTLVSRV